MDSQIQELSQHQQQIFHCKKDKQPSLYLCLDLCCKQPRFACSKCQDLHVSHSNYLFPIEEVTKPDFQESKIADYFEDAHILIKSQSEGMRTVHRLLSKLNSAKEQMLQSIEYIKCELLETMDIREYELNTNRISEVFITPRQDSQEQVEYLLKKVDETRQRLSKGVVQLRQSDTKGFFERQMKKVILEYQNTIKQMREIIGERCTSVDKEKQHNIQIQQNLKRILGNGGNSNDSVSNLHKYEENKKEERNQDHKQEKLSNNTDQKPFSYYSQQILRNLSQNMKEEKNDHNEQQMTFEKQWEQQKKTNSPNNSVFQTPILKQSQICFDSQKSNGQLQNGSNLISLNDNNVIVLGQKQQNNNESIQISKEKGKCLNSESEDENELNKLLDLQNQSRLEAFLLIQNQTSSSLLAQKSLGSGTALDQVDQIIEGDLISKQIMYPLLSLNIEFSSAATLIQKQQQYSIEFSTSKSSNNTPTEVKITIKDSCSGKIIKEYEIFVGKILNEQAEYLGCIFGMYLGIKLGINNIVLMSKSTCAMNLISYSSIDEEFEDYQILAKKLKGLFEKFQNKLISVDTNNQQQPSMVNQTNSSSSIPRVDQIILKNRLFHELIDPFLKTKPDFIGIAKKINPNISYQIEFDGSSKGNRGLSSAGFTLKENNSRKLIIEYVIPVGNMACNQTEYLAAIYGLYTSLKVGVQDLTLLGDAIVVINQIKGIYKVKSDKIIYLHELAKQLSLLFKSCEFHYVKRKFQKITERISK